MLGERSREKQQRKQEREQEREQQGAGAGEARERERRRRGKRSSLAGAWHGQKAAAAAAVWRQAEERGWRRKQMLKETLCGSGRGDGAHGGQRVSGAGGSINGAARQVFCARLLGAQNTMWSDNCQLGRAPVGR